MESKQQQKVTESDRFSKRYLLDLQRKGAISLNHNKEKISPECSLGKLKRIQKKQTTPSPVRPKGWTYILECSGITLPSCARCSAHRHSEGEALGGETENLLQIKQFSILRISKRACRLHCTDNKPYWLLEQFELEIFV